jgi:hypothetical protein
MPLAATEKLAVGRQALRAAQGVTLTPDFNFLRLISKPKEVKIDRSGMCSAHLLFTQGRTKVWIPGKSCLVGRLRDAGSGFC